MALALVLMTLVACNGRDREVVGTWEKQGEANQAEIFQFFDDANFRNFGVGGHGVQGKWEMREGMLCRTIDYGNDALVERCNHFTIQGECLDFDGDLYCKRGQQQ